SAPRKTAPKAAPRTSCAAVPTRISESALATLIQIESSAASKASPSQSAAKAQISVMKTSVPHVIGYDGGNLGGRPAPTFSGVSRRHHQPCGGYGRYAISLGPRHDSGSGATRKRGRRSGRARLRRLPALRGLVVGSSRFDPTCALRSFFL